MGNSRLDKACAELRRSQGGSGDSDMPVDDHIGPEEKSLMFGTSLEEAYGGPMGPEYQGPVNPIDTEDTLEGMRRATLQPDRTGDEEQLLLEGPVRVRRRKG